MTGLHDAHLGAAGYVASPRDGTPVDVLTRVAELLKAHEVVSVRRLGSPGEQLGEGLPLREVVGSFSLPPLDGPTPDLRPVRRCSGTADVRRAVEVTLAEAADWVLIGGALPPTLASVGVEEAAQRGLRVAVEGAAVDTELLARRGIESVEGLLPLIAPPEQRHAPPWEQVAALAERSRPAWRVPPDALAATGVTVVPLLLRERRRSLIEEAVRAPGVRELVGILPYHAYLESMQNPASLRFGRRHVAEHLRVPVLDRAARTAFTAGWERVLEGLRELVDAGVPVAGGSGAPGLGLCPGVALTEERDLWRGAGVGNEVVDHAFGDQAARLTGPMDPRRVSHVQGGAHDR